MKIQCDVCEKAEAVVLCCADEAALCFSCDEKVHAANKLAGKHQRLPLIHNQNHQNQPSCDICQEKAGYFFCLEDRALLCRNCDISIHTATEFVSSHQRFLLTGVKLDDFQHHQHNNNINPKPSNFTFNSSTPLNGSSSINFSPTHINNNFSGETHFNLDVRPNWPSLDEIAATTSTNFDHCYEFSPSELGSSTISSQ